MPLKGGPTLGDSYTPTPEYVAFEFDSNLDDPGILPSSNYWDLDQTFGELCGDSSLLYSVQSFKAEVLNLGGTWLDHISNFAVNVEQGINCIDIPEYYIGTSHDSAVKFSNIFNDARTQIEHELEWGFLEPNTTAVRSRLIAIIKLNLQSQFPGSTFGLGSCQGDVPTSTANYSC